MGEGDRHTIRIRYATRESKLSKLHYQKHIVSLARVLFKCTDTEVCSRTSLHSVKVEWRGVGSIVEWNGTGKLTTSHQLSFRSNIKHSSLYHQLWNIHGLAKIHSTVELEIHSS